MAKLEGRGRGRWTAPRSTSNSPSLPGLSREWVQAGTGGRGRSESAAAGGDGAEGADMGARRHPLRDTGQLHWWGDFFPSPCFSSALPFSPGWGILLVFATLKGAVCFSYLRKRSARRGFVFFYRAFADSAQFRRKCDCLGVAGRGPKWRRRRLDIRSVGSH